MLLRNQICDLFDINGDFRECWFRPYSPATETESERGESGYLYEEYKDIRDALRNAKKLKRRQRTSSDSPASTSM